MRPLDFSEEERTGVQTPESWAKEVGRKIIVSLIHLRIGKEDLHGDYTDKPDSNDPSDSRRSRFTPSIGDGDEGVSA